MNDICTRNDRSDVDTSDAARFLQLPYDHDVHMLGLVQGRHLPAHNIMSLAVSQRMAQHDAILACITYCNACISPKPDTNYTSLLCRTPANTLRSHSSFAGRTETNNTQNMVKPFGCCVNKRLGCVSHYPIAV